MFLRRLPTQLNNKKVSKIMGKFERMTVDQQEENLKERVSNLEKRKGWNTRGSSVYVEYQATMRQVQKWLAENPERRPEPRDRWWKSTKKAPRYRKDDPDPSKRPPRKA